MNVYTRNYVYFSELRKWLLDKYDIDIDANDLDHVAANWYQLSDYSSAYNTVIRELGDVDIYYRIW